MNAFPHVLAGVVLTLSAPVVAIAGESEMTDHVRTLQLMYDRFNARDIDGVVAQLSDDVVWANGMDGGYVRGHDGIRDYWTRQWSMADPHVEPLDFSEAADGAVVVKVKQTIRDLQGNVVQVHGLKDKIVGHVFHFEAGKITRFDIRDEL